MPKFKVGDVVALKENTFIIKEVRSTGDHIEYEADGVSTPDWTLYEEDLKLKEEQPCLTKLS
jgi:hypothetical protein